MTSIDPQRLRAIVLLRSICNKEVPRSTLEADVAQVLGLDSSHISATIEGLLEAGMLATKATTRGAGRVTAQPSARAEVREAFGVTKGQWRHVRPRVAALALGLPAKDFTKKKDRLYAELARRQLELDDVPPFPTERAVLDAMVRRQLGIPGNRQVSMKAVQGAAAQKEYGRSLRGRPASLLPSLVAVTAGATQRDKLTICDLLASRWVRGEAPTPTVSTNGEEAAATRPTPPTPDSLHTFAARVQHSADTLAGAERFGPDKVYIASVWSEQRERLAPTLEAYKQELLRAHQAGLVTLHRADLVRAMDPQKLRDSTIGHMHAEYHFIESPRGA